MRRNYKTYGSANNMDYKEIIEKATRYAQLVAEVFQPKAIVLYGSYAKGTAVEESDIDIAVMFDAIESDYWQKFHELYKLRRKIDTRIEPVLLELQNDKSGFCEDILKTGTVLYFA